MCASAGCCWTGGCLKARRSADFVLPAAAIAATRMPRPIAADRFFPTSCFLIRIGVWRGLRGRSCDRGSKRPRLAGRPVARRAMRGADRVLLRGFVMRPTKGRRAARPSARRPTRRCPAFVRRGVRAFLAVGFQPPREDPLVPGLLVRLAVAAVLFVALRERPGDVPADPRRTAAAFR